MALFFWLKKKIVLNSLPFLEDLNTIIWGDDKWVILKIIIDVKSVVLASFT